MEEKITVKKTWELPVIEIINTKMTKGGSHAWNHEDAYYNDPYAS